MSKSDSVGGTLVNTSVLQQWVMGLTCMQQTVLLTAIRGPDNVAKYDSVKYLLRWYRRCILLSAFDHKVLTNPYDTGEGGSFMGGSLFAQDVYIVDTTRGVVELTDWPQPMNELVGKYIQSLDALPHHFQLHFLHSSEILGYKHPDEKIRTWWAAVYNRLVEDMHLKPESESEMDYRLADNREKWASRNDKATVI